ncbi:acyl-CoA dehydrogenase family protein [Nostoc sp. TCL26-01]|uniref:acyl-CoA dehydrogenase family protein n=1 Tax=Nostoc sp. TCL26-01 TaxID=2576904 RepID=UPI0015BB5DC9|nr:acyl-CoA dehydrogenase family protein [Nostoc sp. TCL26-01]QLE57320.1 monooxygenase [Nostoc sp. TCL26-01]
MVQLLVKEESDYWIKIANSLSTQLKATAVERDSQAGLPDVEIQRLRETGLLSLVVPKEYGGAGATWIEALKVVQELSNADGSIGQLYGNHLNLTTLAQVSGTVDQKQRYYRETAEKNLFWANAINTRDTRLKITPDGEHFRVSGVKSFGTGVAIADLRVFSALQDGVELPFVFVIPKDRTGVASNQDWENIGQRRTDSDTFTFHDVLIKKDEILGYPHPPDGAFSTFLGIIAQLTKTYVYLGLAEGALTSAKQYTIEQTKPWITSGVDKATQDPYILYHYGNFWTQLQAAISLADKAAIQVQTAWEKEVNLTVAERGEVAISVFAAKAFATRIGLDITTSIFEVMGTRSTATKYGFDRYWRDLRTFTLHDPVDYKLRDIGNWVLTQELPLVTQYS